MKNKLKPLLLIVAMLLVIYPSLPAQAKVQSFASMNMELTLPDDALVLIKDTPNTDPLWKEAGIADPKGEKENFDSMGVQALIYDPKTSTSVRILQKQSKKSKDIFHLSLLSDEELKDFLDTFTTIDDPNTSYTIEEYPQQEIPFFRFVLNVKKDGLLYTEIIYATIANGSMISYDIYKENSNNAVDESFIKELVAGTHFTELMDKAEFEKTQRNATLLSIAVLLFITIAIIVIIFIRKKHKARLSIQKKQRIQELSKFYSEQRQNEEANIKDTPLLVNHTMYSEAVVKQFNTYDRFLHHLPVWIISFVLFIVLLKILLNSGAYFGLLISIVIFIVFLYFQGFQYEKSISKTMKGFEKNKSMEAIYTFYDNYYTLGGIQSTSKYPYIQITEIKEYKNFVYIYLGEGKAHYLQKDGFDKGFDEFKKLMKDRK
jgi:hypothetical protein